MYNKKRYKSCLKNMVCLIMKKQQQNLEKKIVFSKAQLATSYFFIWVDTNNLAS